MVQENKNKLLFPALIRHEFGSQRWNLKKNRSKIWRLSNLAFYGIVLLIVATYFSLNRSIDLSLIWNICWGLPWIFFGLSISSIRRESQQGTIGWWLTLPYPRLTLISAKFWAMVLRGWQLMGLFVLGILAFSTYAALISKGLNLTDYLHFLVSGIVPVLLDLLVAPLMVSFGLLIGAIHLTRWHQGMPKLWVIWGLLWIAISSLNSFHLMQLRMPLIITLVFAGSLLLSLILIGLTSWLIEKQLNL